MPESLLNHFTQSQHLLSLFKTCIDWLKRCRWFGKTKETIDSFENMWNGNVKPDQLTFISYRIQRVKSINSDPTMLLKAQCLHKRKCVPRDPETYQEHAARRPLSCIIKFHLPCSSYSRKVLPVVKTDTKDVSSNNLAEDTN